MSTQYPIRRRTFLGATLVAATGLAACGLDDGGSNSGNGDDEQAPQSGGTLRQEMLPVTHLDPAILSGASFSHILMRGLMEGLVVPNEDATDVLEGVAGQWEVSDDLLTYTFHLRSDAKWSNGDAVTAQDFGWNWQRILTPGIAGEAVPSYNDSIGVAGAMAFMNGEIGDFDEVGVKALDEATLEITLAAPNPDFLLMLAQAWALPLHPGMVEENPDDWLEAENWVSNGAFVLDSLRVNQGAVLVPNEDYWDEDNYHLDRWEVTFSDSAATAAILSYQNDEIDVANVGNALNVVAEDPALQDAVQRGPLANCANLVVMTSHNSPLEDVRVRKAFSLAIDREQVADIEAQSVGGSLVPAGVVGSDQIPATEHDSDQARQLLSEAGYTDGDGMPTITILSATAAPWIEAVAEMWRQELGVETTIDQVERSVYQEKRHEIHPDSYVGFYLGSFGVIPPTLYRAILTPLAGLGAAILPHALPADAAEEYIEMQEAGESGSGPEAFLEDNLFPEYQRFRLLAAEALAETDPDRQRNLLIQAAIAREEAYIVIPGFWGGYSFLVRPTIQNLHVSGDTSVFSTRGVTIEA